MEWKAECAGREAAAQAYQNVKLICLWFRGHSTSTTLQNYGGVYVGLPSEAVNMISNQTKTVRKSK
uniref:Uncharacterized protein n=1 Tax=Canis lupus dingo TaxID=286419 RepID=A0A8C0JXH8_CANLU